MKNKSNIVHDRLCTDCYRKLETLFTLHDIPPIRQRGGRGACGICGFRGELTEIEYDRVKDKRTPEETAAIKARRAAAEAPKFRRTEAEREKEKSGAWMRETFERLERISASGRI